MSLAMCPVLAEAGVSESNAAYGEWRDTAEADRIKELCRKCPYPQGCIYEYDIQKRIKLEQTLLDLMGRPTLDRNQKRYLKSVQRQLEAMNSKEEL